MLSDKEKQIIIFTKEQNRPGIRRFDVQKTQIIIFSAYFNDQAGKDNRRKLRPL